MVLQFRVADPTQPLGYRTVDVTEETPLPVTGAGGGADIPEERLVPEGGTVGQVVKADADGLPVWGTDENTTYTAMSAGAAETGTDTTARVISAQVLANEMDRRIAAALAPLQLQIADLTGRVEELETP